MSLRIGEVFAGYRVLRMLGSGGMGEVYLAQHPRLPRQDPSFRERFIREADLAAGLRHPHIVGVHDRGECDGQLWITMDYIDGIDTADLIEQRYPAGMPIDFVIRIVTAVANALDYAHRKGLLHRDVKPANVIVADLDTDDPIIFLADFGVARPLDDVSGLTTTNMTVGTVAYAAPEQLMGEAIDGRADEYALAATTYNLLSGSQPFPNSNPAVVISRHLNATPPKVGDSRADLAGLDVVLQTALAKDPARRFPRCADFASELAGNLNAEGSPSPAAETTPALIATRPGDVRALAPNEPSYRQPLVGRTRRRWLIPTALLTCIFLAGGVALTWHPWKSDRSSSTTAIPPSSAEPTSSAAAPPPPPDPPLFPARSIDQVTLTADRLRTVLGVEVTNDPSLGGTTLALDSSSYGTSDHAAQVTPQSCVGVVFTGEHQVYSATKFEAIKTQTFGNVYGSSAGRGPYLLQQTAVIFGSAKEAQEVLASSQTQWNACSKTEVHATLGYENGRVFTLGKVQSEVDMITVSMASNDGLYGPDACQQALAVRDNVVVESRTCEAPHVVAGPEQGFPKNPGWAVPDAEQVAKAMLGNVIR